MYELDPVKAVRKHLRKSHSNTIIDERMEQTIKDDFNLFMVSFYKNLHNLTEEGNITKKDVILAAEVTENGILEYKMSNIKIPEMYVANKISMDLDKSVSKFAGDVVRRKITEIADMIMIGSGTMIMIQKKRKKRRVTEKRKKPVKIEKGQKPKKRLKTAKTHKHRGYIVQHEDVIRKRPETSKQPKATPQPASGTWHAETSKQPGVISQPASGTWHPDISKQPGAISQPAPGTQHPSEPMSPPHSETESTNPPKKPKTLSFASSIGYGK